MFLLISTIAMSPIKFSTRNVRKALLQLNTSKSSGPDNIPAEVQRTVPLTSPLFSTSFINFRTLLVYSLLLESLPTSFPFPKKVKNLTLQTIALLQSLLLYLNLWRQLSPNNCLPTLKNNNLLSDHQYEFRQARSAGDFLAYTSHSWSVIFSIILW